MSASTTPGSVVIEADTQHVVDQCPMSIRALKKISSLPGASTGRSKHEAAASICKEEEESRVEGLDAWICG